MNDIAAAATSVRKTITVDAPCEVAFEVFTAHFGRWWPKESHHIGKVECEAVLVEPRVGGRCYELGVDGSTCDWGRVWVWEPPRRFVLVWQLSAQWQYDPVLHTEVEVTFTPIDTHRTRVDLEHRQLDAYGDQAATMAAAFGSANGWAGMLALYADCAAREVS